MCGNINECDPWCTWIPAHPGTIPIELGLQNGTLTEGANVRYELDIPEEGVTVRLCVREGSIILYASYTVTNPNEALHDFRREVISTGTINCDDAFIPPENTGSNRRKRQSEMESPSTLFISVVGVEEQNDFDVETSEGDNTVQGEYCCAQQIFDLISMPCYIGS